MPSNQCYDQLSELDRLCVNTIRFLSVDAVQKANSGHPGLPMGMAGIGYSLFTRHLRFNPANPSWPNRDRFVLSAGHGSSLLYSLLHLTGYDVSLEDIKRFRQWGSKTPGHPEYGHTAGVEATTGPLGQGISTAVGMAIAQKHLAAGFNKPDFPIIDYDVLVLAGDGCLQEGISSEACSLAGHLGLDNLVLIYDDNRITIDGRTDISFTEDVTKRFEAYGWFVREIEGDGHDLASFDAAVEAARRQTERPTLIKVRTVIGYGSPNKRDSSGVHGSPLGDDEVRLTKKALGWESEETFFVPEKAKELFGSCLERGATAEKRWRASLAEYGKRYPEESETLRRVMDGTLPEKWEESVPTFESGGSVATRVASGKFIEKVMPSIPFIIGGSADLTPSNNTLFSSATIFQKENPGGRYIHFGVREHAMAAIVNGISLSGLTRAYGATFLCFADYMLPAIRVASLSGYPSIFIFTHDSIGLGEDGPTHQPVEHISYLRAMPGLVSFRPADANETVEAWRFALTHRSGPVAISLTRQGLPVLDQSRYGSAKQLERGGYVLLSDDNPELILIATGSEVSLALEAYDLLLKRGVKTRIVSMPSSELFDAQSEAYRDTVLPGSVTKRVAIEAGIRSGWDRYIGDQGRFIGMTGFGASAPAGELFQHFGIDVDSILKTVEEIL